MFLKLCSYGLVSTDVVVMIVNVDLSQETFAIDMSRALKSSLMHRRKHVLRPLQLYGDQALTKMNLKKDNYFYQLHADGIVSLDLDFKMQFGNRLLLLQDMYKSAFATMCF